MEHSPANKTAVQHTSHTMTIMPSLKKLFGFIAVAVIAGAIPATVLLTQQATNYQQEAMYDSNALSCTIHVYKRGKNAATTPPYPYADIAGISQKLTPGTSMLEAGERYLYGVSLAQKQSSTSFPPIHFLILRIDHSGGSNQLPISLLGMDNGCITSQEPGKVTCTLTDNTQDLSSKTIGEVLEINSTIDEITSRRGLRTQAIVSYSTRSDTERNMLRRGRPISGTADCAVTFDIKNAGPTITTITPPAALTGTLITLTGSKFDTTTTGNSIRFKEVRRSSGNINSVPKVGYIHGVRSTNGTTLQFTLPKSTMTGCSSPEDARRGTLVCNREGLTLEIGSSYTVSIMNPLGESNAVTFSVGSVPTPTTTYSIFGSVILDTVTEDEVRNGGENYYTGAKASVSIQSTNPPTPSSGTTINVDWPTINVDWNGFFSKPNVAPGSYLVTLNLPPGYRLSSGAENPKVVTVTNADKRVLFGIVPSSAQ